MQSVLSHLKMIGFLVKWLASFCYEDHDRCTSLFHNFDLGAGAFLIDSPDALLNSGCAYRLFKEQSPARSYADKGIQVDPSELQSMAPFPQLFPAAGGSGTYLDSSSSPKSHFDRIIEEGSDVSPPIFLLQFPKILWGGQWRGCHYESENAK